MIDLVTQAASPDALRLMPLAPGATGLCACCGSMPATHAVGSIAACMTCAPVFALDEPDIDRVAQLIFLPAMDQGVLSRLVTALHTTCAGAGVTVFDAAGPGRVGAAQRVFDRLLAGQIEAVRRVGTDRLSELRGALQSEPQRRMELAEAATPPETGLRVLMLGRWFSNDPGCYQRAAREWAAAG